jgi:hypothetical protein
MNLVLAFEGANGGFPLLRRDGGVELEKSDSENCGTEKGPRQPDPAEPTIVCVSYEW